MIASVSTFPQDAVFIDYAVDGPCTAGAVARGQSRLIGMAFIGPDGRPRAITQGLHEVMGSFGDLPRIYHDAVLARAIEQHFALPVATSFDDTRITQHLLDENSPAGALARKRPPDPEPLAGSVARVQEGQRLFPGLAASLVAEGLGYVYRQIELPSVDPTVAMIRNGVGVDIELLGRLVGAHEARLEIIRCQIAEAAGTSTSQPAIGESTLAALAELHPAAGLVQKYRRHKAIASDAAGLLRHADARTQRGHPDLDPLGGSTGRFTCSAPALHSLIGPVRDAVVADEGHVLIEADFDQIELRVLAQLSQDRILLDALQRGQDIHKRTAALVLGVAESEVSQTQRNEIGKPVNYSTLYGQSEFGLAEELETTVEEARSLLDCHRRAYPGVHGWIEDVQRQARQDGCVRTLYGRRRRLPGAASVCHGEVARALRQAVNTIVQGTAADINKMAVARAYRALPTEARLLLTVHDSVLLEVPERLVDELQRLVVHVMEEAPMGFTIPIKVDQKSGPTWGACEGGLP